MKPEDSLKHQGLRRQLVSSLRQKGIRDEEVLAALSQVPRHVFMDSAFLKFAYQDTAFPIGADQTISQPYTVAIQTGLLDVFKGCKVLEIGTGSGYQAAVLDSMGCRVFSIERHKSLYKKAKKNLADLNTTVKVFFGDGYKGLPAFAPFDRILVTCGAPEVPQILLDQLKVEGVMVVPLGAGESQSMVRLVKKEGKPPEITRHGIFRFVPMLPDKEST